MSDPLEKIGASEHLTKEQRKTLRRIELGGRKHKEKRARHFAALEKARDAGSLDYWGSYLIQKALERHPEGLNFEKLRTVRDRLVIDEATTEEAVEALQAFSDSLLRDLAALAEEQGQG
jgi:hypothetical protein